MPDEVVAVLNNLKGAVEAQQVANVKEHKDIKDLLGEFIRRVDKVETRITIIEVDKKWVGRLATVASTLTSIIVTLFINIWYKMTGGHV